MSKNGLVRLDDMVLTLDQLNGTGLRKEYDECEKRGKNKHEGGKKGGEKKHEGDKELHCFTVRWFHKHATVQLDDMLLTLDQLNGTTGLDGRSLREVYEECEKRGKNKHEV